MDLEEPQFDVSLLSPESISNLSMEEIDGITQPDWVKLSKLQIEALPVLPIGVRVNIVMTPPEQVVEKIKLFTEEQLKEYPAIFIAALTDQQFDALPPEIKEMFISRRTSGLRSLQELYLSKEALKSIAEAIQ